MQPTVVYDAKQGDDYLVYTGFHRGGCVFRLSLAVILRRKERLTGGGDDLESIL